MILGSVAFVALLAAGAAVAGQLLFVVQPLPFVVATALPWPIAVLTTATAVGTLLAWREGYWSRRVRVYWTVMVLFGLVFVWQLHSLGFM